MWNHGFFILAILSIVFGMGGVSWFFEGFAILRRKRLIENMPTSEIRCVSQGLVEVKGRTKQKEDLYGPVSGTPCVYYTYRVEERQYRQDGSQWVMIGLGESGEKPFYLEDDTGRVLIDPLGAQIASPVSETRRFSGYSSLPQDLKALIDNEKNPVLVGSRIGTGKLMFTENCIGADQEMYVLGSADYLDDDRKEGIVIKRGKKEPFFYISNRREKEITGRMRRSAVKRIIGGPITLGICSFLLNYYYGFSLRYISQKTDISYLFKGWIVFGPVLAVIFILILAYRYYDFTKVLIRSQGT